MTNINSKYASITSLYTLVSLILYLCLNFLKLDNYQASQKIIGFVVILQITLTFIAFLMLKIEFLSLSGSFVWLNYLFHLSQPIIKAVSPQYDFAFDVSIYVFPATYLESLKYSYLMIILVTSGVMFYKCFEKETVYKKYMYSTISLDNLFKIGSIVFSCTFPIEMYIQINRILVARNSGYLATFEVEVSGLISLLATFSLIGMVMMLLGSKHHFLRGNILTGFYLLFYIIAMFSGGRMWQVIKILLILYYYIKTYDIKIKGKNLILIVVIGYLGAGFMSAVADFRAYDVQSSDYILQIISNVFVNNPILQIMEEFGGSVYTVALTIQKTVFELPVSFGKQFLTNFVSLVPNLSYKISEILDRSNYVLLLKMPNIGGSFVGEIYYSFKYFAIFPAFLIGFILQYFTTKIENGIKNTDFHFIIYTIMFQYSVVSWVRGSSAIFYRNTIFGMIFIYVITKILVRQIPLKELGEEKKGLET
ncbi:MAG: O-antigen polysaccharide polymerase Wzy [Carnobacterium sp.]|uniref:O-antigen polysaccharide polymerase Wzy n=1 Tax=Carnobacterium sp. TaxID=48221 RepID=UPI003315AB1D